MFLKINRSPPAGGERGSAVSWAYCKALEVFATQFIAWDGGTNGVAKNPLVRGENSSTPMSGGSRTNARV